jgi:hypothetical protein
MSPKISRLLSSTKSVFKRKSTMISCELIIAMVCVSGGVTEATIVQRSPTLMATAVVIGTQVEIEQSAAGPAPSADVAVKREPKSSMPPGKRCTGPPTAMTCIYSLSNGSGRAMTSVTLRAAAESEIERLECLIGILESDTSIQRLATLTGNLCRSDRL